jgi:predicted ATPase
MLKRIYIDNFRCCSNFELALDDMNLFLGTNGSGKSTVFEVLQKIQALVSGDEKATALFRSDMLTRRQTANTQRFELEIEGNGGLYKYELSIEHEETRQRVRVSHEYLGFDNKPLLRFEKGDAHLYRDDHSEGPTYPFDWDHSAVATLPPRKDNTRLTWFRERMKRIIIIQVIPPMMRSESSKEEPRLSAKTENFVSWYRHVSQDQGKAFEITKALRDILEDFNYFKFSEFGEQHRILNVFFNETSYRFNELSDGQRALIVLYAVLLFARSGDYTLCIDEPENFLALPEIQPWLTLLQDSCADEALQALLISHHPELINYLASSAGYWFERSSNGPVRVRRISNVDEGGIPLSELVARDWIHG